MKLTQEILEDVKKWYLEGNSVRKIAKLIEEKHGVKIGKTTVEYHLKRAIKLRSKKEVMVMKRGTFLDEKEIVKLYTKFKLSLRQIAQRFKASPSGIKWILLKNNVKLRSKRDGEILRKGKYRKPPFKGTLEEKAYLIGIVLGDLHVRMKNSQFTIEVNTTTTRKAMADLLTNIFGKYTDGVICYPDKEKGFRFYAYLDKSFDFLLNAKENVEIVKNFKRQEFLTFLSGFFDAEGSIVKRAFRKSLRYEVKIGNTNKQILEIIQQQLREMKINASIYRYSRSGKYHYLKGRKIINKKEYYMLEIKRKNDVLTLLKILDIKHPEKVERKKEAIQFLMGEDVVKNYYFSTLYYRLISLKKLLTVKEFANANGLNYYAALSYLRHNNKRGFIQRIGKKYVISEKGKDFLIHYTNALNLSQPPKDII
jgi:intein-encoded DNA endonuclease-like protein